MDSITRKIVRYLVKSRFHQLSEFSVNISELAFVLALTQWSIIKSFKILVKLGILARTESPGRVYKHYVFSFIVRDVSILKSLL